MTNPNDVLPREVAEKFGEFILKDLCSVAGAKHYGEALLASIGSRAFKRSLEIAEQIDFGSEGLK